MRSDADRTAGGPDGQLRISFDAIVNLIQLAAIIAADQSAIRLPLSIGATKPVDALARGHAFAIRKDQSLVLDVTDEIDAKRLPGFAGIQAAASAHRRKPPAERVLLVVTPRFPVEEEESLGVELPK